MPMPQQRVFGRRTASPTRQRQRQQRPDDDEAAGAAAVGEAQSSTENTTSPMPPRNGAEDAPTHELCWRRHRASAVAGGCRQPGGGGPRRAAGPAGGPGGWLMRTSTGRGCGGGGRRRCRACQAMRASSSGTVSEQEQLRPGQPDPHDLVAADELDERSGRSRSRRGRTSGSPPARSAGAAARTTARERRGVEDDLVDERRVQRDPGRCAEPCGGRRRPAVMPYDDPGRRPGQLGEQAADPADRHARAPRPGRTGHRCAAGSPRGASRRARRATRRRARRGCCGCRRATARPARRSRAGRRAASRCRGA